MDESPENYRWHLESCSFHDEKVITEHGQLPDFSGRQCWNGASFVFRRHYENFVRYKISLFPWMFICAFIHPVLMVFSPLLSTPPHLCCITLSEVLSGTLFAFSLHFGDTSVKTHQLFQHRFQCHQAPQLWLCKCKSLTGATDTHISPWNHNIKPAPSSCKINALFFQSEPARLRWAERNINWTLIIPINGRMFFAEEW